MTPIRLYIAGPIRKGNLADNIQKATDVACAFAKLGYAPFVPHLSCYFDGPDGECSNSASCVQPKAENRLNAEEWIRIDLAWVEAADILIRIRGESAGADAEIAHAKEHGIMVFEVNGVEDVDYVHKCIRHFSEVQL